MEEWLDQQQNKNLKAHNRDSAVLIAKESRRNTNREEVLKQDKEHQNA